MSVNINDLDNRLRTLEIKLAACRGEEQKKDHDRLTEVITIMEGLAETQLDFKIQQKSDRKEIDQVSGNMNQVAMIVQDLVKNDKAKSRFLYSIIGGIIITVMSALLIYTASTVATSLAKSLKADEAEIISKVTATLQTKQNEAPKK